MWGFVGVLVGRFAIRVTNEEGTWILEEVIKAYIKLHDMGFAMSVETYYEGELIGGLYGINLGKVFCGESMFALMSDASKVALVELAEKLLRDNYDFIDCQIPTEHLKSMGAVEVERGEFLDMLKKCW